MDPAARTLGVHLTRTEENLDEIEALAARLAAAGGGRVGIDGLLGDLDRRLRRTFAPHPRLLGLAVDRALTWEARDRRDPRWYPQGISTSARTGVQRDLLVTSWYSKDGEGSRLSFLDLAARRYRHVLLVEPVVVDGEPGLRPLTAHAGGIVWHGPYVHIAATGRGFWTCRVDDLLRAPPHLGLATYGHDYVLPVRFAYRAASEKSVERLRFSFMTLDRSTDPPALVVGEYGSSRQTRRFARFATDPDTGLLAVGPDGASRPVLDAAEALVRMQGVAVVDGTYLVTSSHGRWTYGHLHTGHPTTGFGTLRWATPPGPEDLVHWPETDLLWSQSEHARRRWVFAMDRARAVGTGRAPTATWKERMKRRLRRDTGT